MVAEPGASSTGLSDLWAGLLQVADRSLPPAPGTYRLRDGYMQPVAESSADALFTVRGGGHWSVCAQVRGEARNLLELYLPVLFDGAAEGMTVGHLGQSLDGCIATCQGESLGVTGPENILHLHRMRALCDAIVVGSVTVERDDPRLTTRLVAGSNPVRVVLDPGLRLMESYTLFNDAEAPTLVVCLDGAERGRRRHGRADILPLAGRDGRLDLVAVVRNLRERGLRRIFVEGGGVTVSGFLQARCLDRLQIAVSPLIIGSGRPGLRLPASSGLAYSLRPACHIYRMGDDVLMDCALDGAALRSADLQRLA
ncbi:MAG: RibD family protein [Gammaproteobacteria bacterium]|nr:RibD family protein [Gammaproteobacteria bacterium]